jgi:hypothetical protein
MFPQVRLALPRTPIQNPMTPLVILDHFARQWPDATPFWTVEGNKYIVMFIDPAQMLRHIIQYNRHGEVVKSENELDSTSCPPRIKKYYTRNFPGQTFDIWSYEDKNGKRYYLKRRSREIWFDENGNFKFKKRVFL